MNRLPILPAAATLLALAAPALPADFGPGLPFEVPARERARIQAVIAEAYANDTVIRRMTSVVEIYGLPDGERLECNLGVTELDVSKLMPGQRVEMNTVLQDSANVCVGR